MNLQADLNDVAQAYKEQRNGLADESAFLKAVCGALQRKVEAQAKEIEELKAKLPKDEAPQA